MCITSWNFSFRGIRASPVTRGSITLWWVGVWPPGVVWVKPHLTLGPRPENLNPGVIMEETSSVGNKAGGSMIPGVTVFLFQGEWRAPWLVWLSG